MKKILAFLLALLIPINANAAFTVSAVMELRSTGGSNLNSGVFDSGVAVPGTDYTQQDSSQANGTNLTSANCTNASPSVTSITYSFGTIDEGNSITISAGTNWTVSTYIIKDTDGLGGATLDKACGSADIVSSGTWREGGAYPMGNSTAGISDDARFEQLVGGNIIYQKLGSYTPQAIAVASTSGTSTKNVMWIGYNSSRTDKPTGTNRPTIDLGANATTIAGVWGLKNLIFTGTASTELALAADSWVENVKGTNTSTNANRITLQPSSGTNVFNVELISQNGIALNQGLNASLLGSYIHDSDVCVSSANAGFYMGFNILESCKTTALALTSTGDRTFIFNNTFYGSEAKIGGALTSSGGIGNSAGLKLYNNIFYGFTLALTQSGATALDSFWEDYNDFYNNTTDRTKVNTGANSIAVNPTFTGASQLTGSTATTSGSTLTQSGGDFSTVTDNIDYLRVVSGTGVTTGIYLITSHAATTLTVNNALGTSSGGDVVWVVPVGHNFAVGTNLKATGFPGAFNSNTPETTGNLDIGAVERAEAGGSDLLGVIQ